MSKTESEKRIEMTEGSQYKSDLDEVYGGESPSPAPASGNAFYVTFSVDNSGNEYVVTADKTGAEMLAAYKAGQVVIGQNDPDTAFEADGVAIARYYPEWDDDGTTVPESLNFMFGLHKFATGRDAQQVEYHELRQLDIWVGAELMEASISTFNVTGYAPNN